MMLLSFHPWLRLRRKTFFATATALFLPVSCTFYWHTSTDRQKVLLGEVFSSLPTILGGGALRFARSLTTGLLISADYKISLWMKKKKEDDDDENDLSEVHSRSARRILRACLKNGGLYVKFGQGLVSMNHVLPKEYPETLRALQDKCPTRLTDDEVRQIVREDLGKDPEEIFDDFDAGRPIAAASLAQVFRARTRFDGRDVAVKVQYRGLRERFDSDVATLEAILKVIEIQHPGFGFAWILKELKSTMAKELDFQQEGANAARCARDLAGLDFVHVPEVLWELCSKRILTAEFIDGIKINELKNRTDFDLKEVDEKLLKTFSEQIFRSGFVHADPHPGNILVRRKKKSSNDLSSSAEIVLLDHGLYQALPSQIRIPLCRVWRAVVENDHEGMRNGCGQLGVGEEDYRIFCMALTQRYVAPPPESDGSSSERERDALSRLRRVRFLPKEERKDLMDAVGEARTKMVAVLQRMPHQLVLVLRNINTIRAVLKDHGTTGVDRYRIMARAAAEGISFDPEGSSGILGRVRGRWARWMFDLRLMVDAGRMFVVRVFRYLGYLPKMTAEMVVVRRQEGQVLL